MSRPPSGPADPAPPHLEAFLDHLAVSEGLAPNSVAAYGSDLRRFARWWSRSGGVDFPPGRADLLAYLESCQQDRLGPATRARLLSGLKRYFRFLASEHRIQADPTVEIVSPRLGRRLPRVLTEDEVVRLLEMPDVSTPAGLRDRTLLEVLYATGLRVSELVHLRVESVNPRQGTVRVTGKGGRERIVPLGEVALDWLERYQARGRPHLVPSRRETGVLFPGRGGRPLTRQAFWLSVRRYALRAGLPVIPTPHVLRHAFATHLVNRGADLRVVQLLLGHRDLATTETYTHVAREALQNLHRTHHPRG